MSAAIREQKMIARICMQGGELKEAEAALHQVIALAPEDPEAYYALGKLLAVQGEFGQAAKLYNRLARLNPTDPKVQIMQADMQRRAEAKKAANANRQPTAATTPADGASVALEVSATMSESPAPASPADQSQPKAGTAPLPDSRVSGAASEPAPESHVSDAEGDAPSAGFSSNGSAPEPALDTAPSLMESSAAASPTEAETPAPQASNATAPPLVAAAAPLDGSGVPDDSGMAALPLARPDHGQAGG
jgi:Tetratricopeptide repeat